MDFASTLLSGCEPSRVGLLEDFRMTGEGPARYACAYLNGRSTDAAPVFLAMDEVDSIADLLDAATAALRLTGTITKSDAAQAVYHPDGAALTSKTKIRELAPNSVLIISCGDAFDPNSVPERARRMLASQLKRRQLLGAVVRSSDPIAHKKVTRSPSRNGIDRLPSPRGTRPPQLAVHDSPWKFSPSGRWESPLALKPERF